MEISFHLDMDVKRSWRSRTSPSQELAFTLPPKVEDTMTQPRQGYSVHELFIWQRARIVMNLYIEVYSNVIWSKNLLCCNHSSLSRFNVAFRTCGCHFRDTVLHSIINFDRMLKTTTGVYRFNLPDIEQYKDIQNWHPEVACWVSRSVFQSDFGGCQVLLLEENKSDASNRLNIDSRLFEGFEPDCN